jgi:hypothetical protein
MSNLNNIGPVSIISYFSFTLIFFIIKSRIGLGRGITWIIVFFMITGIIQFMNNLYLTSLMCGNNNMPSAFFNTLIPWVLIFGSSILMLILIPGWLRVFSNTFGFMVAEWAGLNATVAGLFKTPSQTDPKEDLDLYKTIEIIAGNPLKIINEIKLDDYTNENEIINWPSLDLLTPLLKTVTSQTKTKLYDLLVLKEDIGYFVWFILIGTISILVSTNSVLISKCSGPV